VHTPDDDFADLRSAIRKICDGFPDSYWRAKDEAHEFPWNFYTAMAGAGWVGLAIPAEYGGQGAGITEASVLLEEIAASGAAMNGASALHLSIFGMNPVVQHGSDDLKKRYLPRVAAGELHVAFGVTEPDAGTNTAAITTRAEYRDGIYHVTGQKVWTTKATVCEKVLLLVRTSPPAPGRPGTDGLTLLLADLQRPDHVDIRPIPKLGRNAVVSCEVRYDALPVPESDRVGAEGRGFEYLLDGLNPERILVAAEALGIGRAALARAARYARERVVFGRPIGQNQAVSFPLAQAHAQLRAAELAIRDASWRYDHGLPAGEQANIAKYLAAEAAYQAADQAVQTHGGFGYAREYDVERYWREARLMRLAPITQEMVLSYLAEHVLKMPRSHARFGSGETA
jgi:acyl-CoA dehydrogenase